MCNHVVSTYRGIEYCQKCNTIIGVIKTKSETKIINMLEDKFSTDRKYGGIIKIF